MYCPPFKLYPVFFHQAIGCSLLLAPLSKVYVDIYLRDRTGSSDFESLPLLHSSFIGGEDVIPIFVQAQKVKVQTLFFHFA